MKHFFKDVLILLCILIVITGLFEGVSSSSKQTKSDAISSEINNFEENISNGQIVSDGVITENEIQTNLSGNFIGTIGLHLTRFVIMIVSGIIKAILFVISKII